MFLLLILPLAAALIAIPIVKRAPIHGALLAGWAAMTFLGFAPGGLMASGIFLDNGSIGGVLIILVSLSGFLASAKMLARLSRLYRGQPLGSGKYLVAHHAAVVFAFFVAELISGRNFHLSAFCLAACVVGALIVGYDRENQPFRQQARAQEPHPVAF